ncbi:hypothetical protein THAOC_04605, partial [Thalassiosira oceanica]
MTDDDADEPLSDYEKLRLQKIRRNEDRLKSLGLMNSCGETDATARRRECDRGRKRGRARSGGRGPDDDEWLPSGDEAVVEEPKRRKLSAGPTRQSRRLMERGSAPGPTRQSKRLKMQSAAQKTTTPEVIEEPSGEATATTNAAVVREEEDNWETEQTAPLNSEDWGVNETESEFIKTNEQLLSILSGLNSRAVIAVPIGRPRAINKFIPGCTNEEILRVLTELETRELVSSRKDCDTNYYLIKNELALYLRGLTRRCTMRPGDKVELAGNEWSPDMGTCREPEHEWNAHLGLFQQLPREMIDDIMTLDNTALRFWFFRQLNLMENGMQNADRIQKLFDVGLICYRNIWGWRHQQLVDFHGVFGHSNVPHDFPNEGLFEWTCHLRKKFLHPRLKLLLGDLSFSFRCDRFGRLDIYVFHWDAMFARLERHKQVHGDCRVTKSQDKKLAKWVCDQRRTEKNGTMPADRKRRLDAIEFIWDASEYIGLYDNGRLQRDDGRWDKMFARLEQHKQVHGSLDGVGEYRSSHRVVSSKDKELGIW